MVVGQGDDGRPRAAARAIVESLGSDLREPSLRASFFARLVERAQPVGGR